MKGNTKYNTKYMYNSLILTEIDQKSKTNMQPHYIYVYNNINLETFPQNFLFHFDLFFTVFW